MDEKCFEHTDNSSNIHATSTEKRKDKPTNKRLTNQ